MSARHNVARSLAPYQRIAVWGAGSLAALAMDRWLPRERVVAVLDSDPAKQGKTFHGLPVSDPATADLGSFDVIVVCITAYLEAFEAIARRNYRGPFFYIYELMAETGGAPQSELEKLSIDYQRTRNGNLFLTLLSRPQFLTVVTYRLTRHCDATPLLRPLFYVALFFHYLFCAFSRIELPYTVKAGAGLWFPHLGGAVFNKDVELGACVSIFQFTTIGADDTGRMPRIGSFVTVNTGAVVLGDAQIGDHSRIGANATVLGMSCPPGSTLVGTPARVTKTQTIVADRMKAAA
jgi:serine O-acetyltransferase